MAAALLRRRFGRPVAGDIRQLRAQQLPPVDLLSAGFPCQDLSQAGQTRGLQGPQSGLVWEVFRLLEDMRPRPTWLLLETVPFALSLNRGEAMRRLTGALAQRGWRWAYRTLDTLAFGLPQRRRRVFLLASPVHDPRPVLLDEPKKGQQPELQPVWRSIERVACGFNWTEGVRGLGWAVDAVPPLRAGSGLGIPSPPAIWLPAGQFVTPDLRDAERLQGFEADWTKGEGVSAGQRWRMVGNAVSVPVSRWIGQRLRDCCASGTYPRAPWTGSRAWPSAAWGEGAEVFQVDVSSWPVRLGCPGLARFLAFPPSPLSLRAALGFRNRTRRGNLRFVPEFLEDLDRYIGATSQVMKCRVDLT